MMRPLRVGTQAFNRVNGERKQMTFTGPDGIVRPLEVELDLKECDRCGATIIPGGGREDRHERWHLTHRNEGGHP